jgi:Tc5 transposase DNA-binding domain
MESSQQRQTLSPEEEQVLLDWCRQRAQESRPWTPQKLRARAHEIFGKTIGEKWHTKFEKRHREILKSRPAKLDPKRAQTFNKASIGDFYDKYGHSVEQIIQ